MRPLLYSRIQLLTRAGICRYMIQRYARKMHGRVFGKMFDPILCAH